MKRVLSRYMKRMIRKGEVGQTLVIMAFGFVVLLAFVGIVTDVSLMFVRYSTLRRAIDAAAVAAAGQMRRAAATEDEIARAKAVDSTNWERIANGYAYARNIASVNLAARQFMELYGVDPTTVLVDTCATTQIEQPDGSFVYTDPALECETSKQPRKLVRVTAQVESPTVFLRLIGWGNVTLEATAISETAVLDVVMIFDVSESMANQTSYKDWDEYLHAETGVMKNYRYMPPRMTFPPVNILEKGQAAGRWGDYIGAWTTTLGMTQNDLYNDSLYDPIVFSVNYNPNGSIASVQTESKNAPGQMRQDCRVRFFPGAQTVPQIPNGQNEYAFDNIQVELTRYMNSVMGISGNYPPAQAQTYDGFIGAYNYFGCCNAPDSIADTGYYEVFDFTDLICQPMKKVRDATEDFFNRIDFSRGDRVGLVTFDRSAYLIDPDGAGPQTHMITSQVNAADALKRIVGVRAEPNFYADTDDDGLWDSYVIGGVPYGQAGANVIAPDGFNTEPLGGLNDYPVKDNCYFLNATLPYPRSLYSSPGNIDIPSSVVFPARFPAALSGRYPLPFDSNMWPPLNDPAWDSQMNRPAPTRDLFKAYYAYEFRAGCRGSNVGAALRVANNALVDPETIRTNGAVWVMVMLGDGAAAATDPVRRNGNNLIVANPYTAPDLPPTKGDYGVFGLCPYGQPSELGALVDNDWSRSFPYCMDTEPETRHFCFDPRIQRDGQIYIDIGRPECNVDKYDADDFARDWADFIGLTDPFPALVTADELDRNDLQLPTIFTIGFGLDFQAGDGSCDDNISDCLGEELLRYIADVGDNNRIDTDYQQDLRADGQLDKGLALGDEYGTRGACEDDIPGFDTADDVPGPQIGLLVQPLPEGESCGNYFNAPDEQELQEVFDTIASRMFTRLTR